MLDVHLPHKLHGAGEFFLHLFTITVGLLIAVQIESFVEWRHHLHLAEEARAELRLEIAHNLEDYKQMLPGLKVYRQKIDVDLDILRLIQEHRTVSKEQLDKFGVSTGSAELNDTAWKTAQTTGALAYMPYEEAEAYSSIYQSQAALLAMADKPMEEGDTFVGLLAKFHLQAGELSKLNAEQASEIAEILGRMRMQMAVADTQLQNNIEGNSAFLEHRKARAYLDTNLK
jgi:hypothetical protein